MSACVCTSTCGGQRLISGVCFYSSTLYVLRPLNSSSLSPADQLVQGILRCWYNRQPQPHLPAIFNGPGDPISGHHTCMASGLPIEPLPQTPAMPKTFLNSTLFKICLKLNLSSTHVSFHQQLLRVSRLWCLYTRNVLKDSDCSWPPRWIWTRQESSLQLPISSGHQFHLYFPRK